ncbi:unnamed protein product [Peronospora belbahrii]|uniref:C2H2-type domain-containing protein n=1 Tax=Peronospora belbahrii TaxID=622444 RepID=A0AAU9KRC2_9STRA|nr:unnamed protein product [Peronospora belbahrii]
MVNDGRYELRRGLLGQCTVVCRICCEEFTYAEDYNDHLICHQLSSNREVRLSLFRCELCGLTEDGDEREIVLEEHMKSHEISARDLPQELLWVSELPSWWPNCF